MIYALLGIAAVFCAFIQWGDEIPLPNSSDLNQKEAQYIHNVNKKAEKEKFQRTKLNRHPSGFMTLEEYELLSSPKDRMLEEIEIPQLPTPADMVYVPQPNYRIVKYNNPPGVAEISLNKTFYEKRQQNAQGIVSPDFKKLVYPSVYYYPDSASTACDLFVINLEEAKSNLHKILTANVIHRLAEPILSTDKNIDNYFTFRTLTPVDFSVDGSKLLVKEKIGNSKDGIWKTTPIVYDFTNNVSYNLVEVRDAIAYYWEENKGVNLEDKRWDVYPLGFAASDPDWVVVNAYAYTGGTPVNLGTWTVNYKGEQSRLLTFKQETVEISMNGYRLIKDGVIAPTITEMEQEQLKRIEKAKKKKQKEEDKAYVKDLEASYKAKIKEMEEEFKIQQKDYKLRKRIQGSTSDNDVLIKYNKIKEEQAQKEQQKLEKLKQKELKRIEKEQKSQDAKAEDENNNSENSIDN